MFTSGTHKSVFFRFTGLYTAWSRGFYLKLDNNK